MASRNQRQGVGLRQVYPDPDDKTDTDIDIIAIHGLDTKSPDTWTWVDRSDPKIRVNWLQDSNMLPSKVQGVRIFTCDWSADLLQPSDLIQKALGELALLLFDGIQGRPPATSDHARREDRPILFIASCLGGIILIKALVEAGKRDNSLQRATRGIIFLATPFRGTSFQEVATWAEPGLKAWASTRGQEVNNLVANVKGPTFDLDALVRNFTRLSQKYPPCQVFNFYELGKTSLPRKLFPWLPVWFHQEKQLVNSSSATLDMVEDPLSLDRPHVLMNKFKGPECSDYDRVARKIQDVLGKIRDGNLLEQADAWIRDKHYTETRLKIERLSGDQLSMDQCYINLAIIEQPGRDAARSEGSKSEDTPPHSSPFSLSARLKIETPDKNIQVKLQTLFDPRKRPDGHTIQPRRIFIRGRAGVGKTTLCKKMVYDFKNHKNRKDRKDPIWNDLFDRILWVPLRTLKRKPDKGYNLEGLFLRDFFSNTPNRVDLAKELERALDTTKFSRTLFILDGLDEVSEGLDKDNEMHQFLKFLLEQPNVIITSRPSARLPDSLHLDLELETIGFYTDQVKTYIEKAFTDPTTVKIDPKAGEVLSFLQDHRLIQGLVRIPIQLDTLYYTWNKSSLSEPALETMTAMYQAIEHRLWKKDVLLLEKTHDGKLVTESFIQEASRAKIEGFVKDEIFFLERLAFGGLHNDTIDFGSKHRNAIADLLPSLLLGKTLPYLSFLRTSDPLAEDYHFLHLTYQEYFAARYFVRQWTSNQVLKCLKLKIRETRRGGTVNYSQKQYNAVSYLRKHKYNARYDIFWRFVAGLLQAKGDDAQLCRFFRTIEEEPRDLLGPVHQRLVMHCLSEVDPSQEISEFKRLRKDLEGQLKQWLLFECNFEFNNAGRLQLAAEMEFPEQILKDILQKESEDIKWKILYSLKARPRLPLAIIELISSYLGGDVSIRLKKAALTIFDSLYEDLPDEIVQAVAALLKDPDREIRSIAVRILGRQSALPDEIVQAIAALIKDLDWSVRSAAVEALGQQSALPDEIAQAVAALLKDPNWSVSSTAVKILGQQSALPDEIVQAVAALLKDPDREIRFIAAQALGQQSALADEIAQAVAALLKDLDEYVRYTIVQVLGQQSTLPDEIIQAVAALLKDPDWSVRSAAVWVLGQQSALPDEIVQAVAALLKDPNWSVRSAAVEALSQQSALPDEIAQAVAALLKDWNWSVRSATAEALLKDPNWGVSSTAVEILGRQSALPDEIVQAVAALLKDPNRSDRSAAVRVLGRQSALSDEKFYNFLLKLDSQSFINLYGVWLRRSFSDHLTWYIKGKNYSISIPEGGRNVPFNQLKSAVQEAQAFLKVPLLKELQ